MEDLPNGFLNYPKKRPDFESAGDAIRRHMSDAEFGKVKPDNIEAQRRAFRDGWRVSESSNRGIDTEIGISVGGGLPLDLESGEVRFPKAARSQTGRNATSRNDRHDPRTVPGHIEYTRREIRREPDEVRRYRKGELMHYMRVSSPADEEIGLSFDYSELERISELDRRWSWIEINLEAIESNIKAIRQILDPSTKFMAVVKADGYGHGAVPCARAALKAGADYIGVATVDEAMEIRQAGIEAPLLILSEPPLTSIPLLLGYDIMPSVATVEFAIRYAEAADSIGKTAPYHLKVNTGMNRVGVRYDSILDFLQTISFHRALKLVGTFTHFATADTPDTMDFNLQKQRFDETLATMRAAGFDPGIVHAANSAATIRYRDVHYDMVRPGLAMYGYFPCSEAYGAISLMPAMSIKARITQINQVPVGEGVSYGLLHRSNGFGKICTIPIGYADGLNRALSGRIDIIKDGKLYPQVGTICMDQCMFEMDVRTRSGIGKVEPHIGDEVIVIGEQGNSFTTIDQMADLLGSIPYEVMINFGNSRMPKIYV